MISRVLNIFCFLFFWTGSVYSVGDTTQQQFPITDPRNPNCPCHDHQKKAEEEYKRLLNKRLSQGEGEQSAKKTSVKIMLLRPIKATLELPVIEGEIKNTDSTTDQINKEKHSNISTSVTKNRFRKFIFQSERRIKKMIRRKKRFKNSYDVSGCWG